MTSTVYEIRYKKVMSYEIKLKTLFLYNEPAIIV